ncbi:MAG: hypothetical protein JST21_05500, partial [Bacteroidetes bacterium]|nr:hypothetical protein [Bacteroidota bacterium]
SNGDVLAVTVDGSTGYYNYQDGNYTSTEEAESTSTLPDVTVTTQSKKESNNSAGLPLSGLGLGTAYGETKMFNQSNWYDLAKGRSYSQRYFGNQSRAAEDVRAAKGLSKTVSRGFRVFGWGIGLWNQYSIINDNEMSNSQKGIETGSNVISTFGGVYGAAWGVGWEAGRVLTQQVWYRQNVRPHIQDALCITRDEYPKLDPAFQGLLNNLDAENQKR